MGLARFIVYYLMFVVALGALSIALPIFLPNQHLLSNSYWLLFGFLSGITLIASVIALKGIENKPETGILFIMVSIILKMLFSMGFVLVYALRHSGKDLAFIFNFFILYFLLTGFEIYGLLINLRHQNKK